MNVVVYYILYVSVILSILFAGVTMVSHPYWAIIPLAVGIVSMLFVTERGLIE